VIYSKKEFIKQLIKKYPGQVRTLGQKFLNKWPVWEFVLVHHLTHAKWRLDQYAWMEELINRVSNDVEFKISTGYKDDWRIIYLTFHSREEAFEFQLTYL